ncbi:hypothetical protein C8J56DRAFT_1068159 [Mycena floridula]|nr:hypothetical protein C8J56DRAFT_1068159 [Mycena floridula]
MDIPVTEPRTIRGLEPPYPNRTPSPFTRPQMFQMVEMFSRDTILYLRDLKRWTTLCVPHHRFTRHEYAIDDWDPNMCKFGVLLCNKRSELQLKSLSTFPFGIQRSDMLLAMAIDLCIPFQIAYSTEALTHFSPGSKPEVRASCDRRSPFLKHRVSVFPPIVSTIAVAPDENDENILLFVSDQMTAKDYRNKYRKVALKILRRNNAVASMMVGGEVTWLARSIRPELLELFKLGPSIQVRDGGGEIRRGMRIDVLSDLEKQGIVGHFRADHNANDRFLFPTSAIMASHQTMPLINGWSNYADYILGMQWSLLLQNQAETFTVAQWHQKIQEWMDDLEISSEYIPSEIDWTYGEYLLNMGYNGKYDGKILDSIILPQPLSLYVA